MVERGLDADEAGLECWRIQVTNRLLDGERMVIAL